jgi:serine/threonine protein kinase
MNGKPEHDKEKAEVWLIGVLVLNCMSLTHYDKFYNWKELTVDNSLLETTLYKIGGVYSPLLRDLVEHCLEPTPKKRCSMAAIKQFVTIRKQ